MSNFPDVEKRFRERFGFRPDIPIPGDIDSWARVLQKCLDAGSPQGYHDAFKREVELLGEGVW